MQKKIIALAVAGLMSGAAFAQTNVTIYGAADVTFDNVKAVGDSTAATAATNGNLPARNRVSGNSSFLGFRGSEDLGGGLKAVFQFEGGVANDAAGAFNFNRDTFVGLAGGFGTVAAGILTGPTRGLGSAMDPFIGATGITANTAIIGKLGGGAGASMFDTRWNNAIAYISPAFSGLTVTAAYVANENKSREGCAGLACQANTWGYDFGLRYSQGPILAGLTQNHVKVGDVAGTKLTATRAAFRYDFGMGTVGLMYDHVKDKDNVATEKRTAWFLPVTFKVGANGKIVGQYGKAGDVSGNNIGDEGAKMFAIGYEHSLSKRTTLKAVWSQIKNDANAFYDFGVNAVGFGATAAGADPKGFQLGVRHTF